MPEYSVSPEGKRYPLPGQVDYAQEFKRVGNAGGGGTQARQGNSRGDGGGVCRGGDGGDNSRHER